MKDDSNEDVPPIVDKVALEELRSIMEDEFSDVLQIYLEESIKLMSDVHTGFSDESENLLRYVHTLKSSSKNVGLSRLGSLAAKMEALINEGDVESARSYLDELQDVYTQSHAVIKSYVQNDVQKEAS